MSALDILCGDEPVRDPIGFAIAIAKRTAELNVAAKAHKALEWFDEYGERAVLLHRDGVAVSVKIHSAGSLPGAEEARVYLHAALALMVEAAMAKAVVQAKADLAVVLGSLGQVEAAQ